MRLPRQSFIQPFACVAALTLSGQAMADFDGAVANSGLWSFEFTHMPDFDQPRDELPGDGWNHCVPTSTLNLMAYIAAHGLPGLQPGVANWRADSLHGLLSFHLNNLGNAMSTDPSDGTTSDNQHDGTVWWLSGYPGYFNVETQWQTNSWSPRYNDVALRTILDNGLSTICVGWYTGSTVVTRNGGHCMTLVEGASNWPDQVVTVRDPAMHDGDLNRQSAYASESYTFDAVFVRPSFFGSYRMMDEMLGRASAPTRAIMDSYQVIYPTYMLTDTAIDFMYEVVQPWELFGDVDKPVGPFIAVPNANVCDIIAIPDGKVIIKAIPDSEPWLTELHVGHSRLNTEDVVQINPLGQDLFALRDVIYGRHRCLYMYDQELGMMCYSLDENTVTQQVSVSGGAYDSLAYIDDWDAVIALRVGTDTITRYDRWLGVNHVYEVPCCHSVEHGAQLEPDPDVPGRLWIWHPATTELYRLDLTEGGSATMELVDFFEKPISDMTIGNGGVMVTVMGGQTWQYDVSGGALKPIGGLFQGHPANTFVTLSKSTNNYDQEIHQNIQNDVFLGTTQVPSIPDCIGDFDHDGIIGIGDLLMLLEAWSQSDPYIDIAPGGGDEIVSVPDLLELLSEWGPCP